MKESLYIIEFIYKFSMQAVMKKPYFVGFSTVFKIQTFLMSF